jgi:hypothetical protein
MVVGNHPRALLGLVETPWSAQQGQHSVDCTIHRCEGGYAVLAGHAMQNLLRITYTPSLEIAREVAADWLRSLVASGFSIVRVDAALGHQIEPT